MCGQALAEAGGSARCPAGHSFDFARSGYLNLSAGGGRHGRVGDTAEMVRAREELLAAGHFERLARAVGEVAEVAEAGSARAAASAEGAGDGAAGTAVVEVGCGTGYYLGALAAALAAAGRPPDCMIGVDLSKAAAGRAARLHPGTRFLVADVEQGIPLRDAAAGLALSVFAPRPAAELGRVVRPGGTLLVALAGPRHLERLRERLSLMAVGEDKLGRLTERLAPWFEPRGAASVEYELHLSEEDARRLVLMGPNARHDPDLTPLAGGHEDRASVTLASFLRRPGPALH